MTRTTESFSKARVGSVAMAACGACHQSTGEILIKKQSTHNAPEYVGPRLVLVSEEARCEFCAFLGHWMAQEKADPRETGLQYGAMKLVENTPERKLIAFVPFSSAEDLNKGLADGTPVVFKHRMIIGCERDGEGMKLVAVLEQGV
jgi:hypothetical protein